MAIYAREADSLSHLVHHSDRGVQYLSIRYTERLAEAGLEASVGSRGDSYDNALAESFNGLYKAELVFHDGPWKSAEEVEWATLTYVDWFNNRRLHGEIGMVPPAEFEKSYYRQREPVVSASSQATESL
jgi:putative transposase